MTLDGETFRKRCQRSRERRCSAAFNSFVRHAADEREATFQVSTRKILPFVATLSSLPLEPFWSYPFYWDGLEAQFEGRRISLQSEIILVKRNKFRVSDE